MIKKRELFVWMQLEKQELHPISRKILMTALALGQQAGLPVHGLVFTAENLSDGSLSDLGLDQATVFENPKYDGFLPEFEAEAIAEAVKNRGEILLFPATPEGRTLSSMTAAILHTGVTADCTALSFTADGLLLQTRPAFSGSKMAEIITPTARPQIASLRFSMPVSRSTKKTILNRVTGEQNPKFDYPVQWIQRREPEKTGKKDIVLAVGGGLQKREDLALFEALAKQLGGELYCSRALVDRGWMPRQKQIGLSGQSISARLLITFGISGSVQFRAGLEETEHLCAVNSAPDAPIFALADTPIQGDLYEIARRMRETLCPLP